MSNSSIEASPGVKSLELLDGLLGALPYMLYHNATLEGGADCRRSACIERYVRNPDGSIPFIKATRNGVSAK